MSHRMKGTSEDVVAPFATVSPTGERLSLLQALRFMGQNPDYLRELDRGDSMQMRESKPSSSRYGPPADMPGHTQRIFTARPGNGVQPPMGETQPDWAGLLTQLLLKFGTPRSPFSTPRPAPREEP